MRSGNGKMIGGIVLVLLGIVFLLTNYGLLGNEIWKLWPLILIIIGAGMLLRKDECRECGDCEECRKK